MAASLTKRTTDHSDASGFSFSFFCDRCSMEWRSKTEPFTCGGLSEIEKDEAKRLLWADERRTAFNAANMEAQFRYGLCPVCGRRICADCTKLGEVIDLCIDCAESQKTTASQNSVKLKEGLHHGK